MKKKQLLALLFATGACAMMSIQAGFWQDFWTGFKKPFHLVAKPAGCLLEVSGMVPKGCELGEKAAGLLNAVGDVVTVDLSKLPVDKKGRIVKKDDLCSCQYQKKNKRRYSALFQPKMINKVN